MKTSGFRLPKTPQNHTIAPAHLGQVCPFCVQNLRIWPKTRPFVCRPPSIQVSFLVSFLYLCHLLKPATPIRNTCRVLRNTSRQFPARFRILPIRNAAVTEPVEVSIAHLNPQISKFALKQGFHYQTHPLSCCKSRRVAECVSRPKLQPQFRPSSKISWVAQFVSHNPSNFSQKRYPFSKGPVSCLVSCLIDTPCLIFSHTLLQS